MRAVVQRVKYASVTIADVETAAIGNGLLILIGIEDSDEVEDSLWMSSKLAAMRIFSDSEGKMNLDINAVNGECLLVSQFTLHASTAKGNRPSFIRAARPEKAIPLYETFKTHLQNKLINPIHCGEFGADMQIELLNDGPVTIVIDSKLKD